MTDTESTAAGSGTSSPRITLPLLVTLALLNAVAPFATDLYLAAFPLMVDDLHTSATNVQLTLTTFLVGLALGQLLFGPLSDRFGRFRPLLIGSAVCVLASVVTVVAPNIEVLIVARLVQGLSGAAGMVIGRAVIADLATGRAAARAFSLMMMVGGLAPIIAPLTGGLLVDTLGWRGVLTVVLGLAVLMFVATLAVVRESHPRERRAAMRTARSESGSPARDLLQPVYVGNTAALCFGFAVMMAYISASPFVYQTMMGMSSPVYGAMFGINSFGLLSASALSARLHSRVAPGTLAGAGVAIILFSSVAVLLLSLSGLPAEWLAVPLFTAVSSMGLIFGNATALAMSAVPRAAGTASAVLGAVQFMLGAAVSPLVSLGGEHTAVPLGIVMVCSAVCACAGYLFGRRDPQLA